MRSFIASCASWLAVFAFVGCTGEPTGPTKEVQIPAGGEPVLTTAERAKLEGKTYPTSAVARTSFEEPQPLLDPRTVKPLENWTEQEAAADALGRIGAAAVPSLVESLANPDPAVRHKSVAVLGRMGPDAAPAVPALIKLLDDPDPDVRKAAARTLGQIGPAARDAVPELMQSLLKPAL